MNLKQIFKINYNYLYSKNLINNIIKLFIFYFLLRFKDIEFINKKIIIEIDNKVNEGLYESNLDFYNYSTPIKIISIYYPEFLNNSNYFENDSKINENMITLFNKNYKKFQIKDNKDIFYLNSTSNLELIKNQAKLAKSHGIYGFAIYYYRFSGKKIYNEAINIFLENKEININFLNYYLS